MDAPTIVASVYAAALAGGFLSVAVWESLAPARAPRVRLGQRWPTNLTLLAVNQIVVPWLVPVTAASAAWLAQDRGWGLANLVAAPVVVAFAVTLLAFDVTRYLLHRALHGFPPLWRLHRVHHSDVDYDCTLALRFHPLEAVVSAFALAGVAIAIGAPPWAVVASDALTLAAGLFAHGNARLGPSVERALRRVLVTPALHATHHSVVRDETDSNFGAVFSWWDRMGGTFRERARAGDAIVFGLPEERDVSRLGLGRLLAMPFVPARDARADGGDLGPPR